MHIERIQVEAEGFLGSLDVSLTPGLNVVIGARGTGKTSLVELIRFALDAGAFTEDANTKGRQQAVATLGEGAVTLTIRDEELRYVVTRSSSGRTTSTEGRKFVCTVLAQNEVEAVGAQASGRLHLLDRFRRIPVSTPANLEDTRSRVASLTAEIGAILGDGLEVSRRIAELDNIPGDLADAKIRQQTLLESSTATLKDREQLEAWQSEGQLIAARETVLVESAERVRGFMASVEHLAGSAPSLLQSWPAGDGNDPLTELRPRLTAVVDLLSALTEVATGLEGSIRDAASDNVSRRAEIDARARQLRQQLEAVQSGVEGASRRVSELEERQGQRNALQSALIERRERFRSVFDARENLYSQLDAARDETFDERVAIASLLNDRLGPIIRVRVTRSEDKTAYRAALVAALRGSGLHYNSLASIITERLSPYELTTWIELGEIDEIASALEITPERASALIAALRQAGLAEVLTSQIDDGVALDLLDGKDYKSSERLSIGQRCTVVLPLLLGHNGDPLIVDQPEDHLDNAFIASTLVPALRSRTDADQYIFSSHNANIPVLAEADNVLVMDSDGDRGYVAQQGALEDEQIVDAVSRLMEGGVEAFEARATFYGRAVRAGLQ